jgi:AraC-like DNA-binding protein
VELNQTFVKYRHDYQERVEVPMHSHNHGQLNFVSKGTMRLMTPNGAWVVPQQKIVWIPPNQRHSIQCKGLLSSWKIVTPQSYRKFLPPGISVLQTSNLLAAALNEIPESKKMISPVKLKLLIELIKQELQSAKSESFGVTLPKSSQFSPLTDVLLKNPEDPRTIDQWAKAVGMSRRTFTRQFIAETGSPFAEWKKTLLFGKALNLLSEGHNVDETASDLGYSSSSAFVAAFGKRFRTTPGQFFS